MAKRGKGRPTLYSRTLINQICALFVEGKTLRQVCDMPNMPDKSTICAWLASKKHFTDQYARIKAVQAHIKFEDLSEISRQVRKGELEPQAGRVCADIDKWQISKMFPKVYGDKAELDHTGRIIVQPATIDKPPGAGEGEIADEG